jgi:phosphopantothenoylcysteine decarboxylase / phosphopantothenate---cysteine ligase
MALELVRNPDILAEVAASSPRPFVVGFAAETENVEANARLKLESKALDMIAANQVGTDWVRSGRQRAARALAGRPHGSRLRQQDGAGAERLLELIGERLRAGHQAQDS